MSIAIHYTSINLSTGREREVFGLQVAIADWLMAYFRYARSETFSFLIGDGAEWDEVHRIAAAAGIDANRLIALDRRFPEKNFANLETIFRPEPDTRHLLWQRQQGGSFSFCGLAHAISGIEAGAVLQEYCLAPSEATDAIVCPSRAVRAAIGAFWNNYGDYLQARFGAAYQCPAQLPIIPLGIDIDKFAAKVTPDKRAAQRAELGIAEDDIVLLWVGRLSAAIKAHPLAMFQAAEQAAALTGVKVHLVMVGYFVPAEAEAQFKNLASDICRKATVTFIAADDPRFDEGLWAAGDIFLSLIDNMQESFGLTPIEAMAAGLPRVLSDWDGYRDSVKDGEDGFLIRTTQPPPEMGFDLTTQVLNGREVYGGFLAKAALTVAVDVGQAAERIAQLMRDKNLRASMAEKAKLRVREIYDWRHIIPAYENLWRELSIRRQSAPPQPVSWKSAMPILPDPYTMYSSYPTSVLDVGDRMSLVATFDQIRILWQHALNTYANDILIPATDIPALLGWLEGTRMVTIGEVFARFPAFDKPRLWRTLGWLQKLGIIKNSLGEKIGGQ